MLYALWIEKRLSFLQALKVSESLDLRYTGFTYDSYKS